MPKLLKYLLVALVLVSSTTINLVDGKCSKCLEEGKKSTVTCDGFASCTLAYCGGGHYDEEGNYHSPSDCNTCSRGCRCSNGHEWSERSGSL